MMIKEPLYSPRKVNNKNPYSVIKNLVKTVYKRNFMLINVKLVCKYRQNR